MAEANIDAVKNDYSFYEKLNEYNFEHCKYSLLILGPSGTGKSAFCNFLLKEKRFKEAFGFAAVTVTAEYCVITCEEEDMVVVDCPGFCDPKRTPDEIITEISKAAILCRNGMHAIGIVIDPTSRFTDTQKNACHQIELFGGDFLNHSFIIFNHENDIIEQSGFSDASEYIEQMKNDKNCPEAFISIMEQVGNRFIFVESSKRWNDEVYLEKVKDSLVAMILQVKENNEIYYSNLFTQHARSKYDKFNGTYEIMKAQIESIAMALKQQQDKCYELESARNLIYLAEIEEMRRKLSDDIKEFNRQMAEIGGKKNKKCRLM